MIAIGNYVKVKDLQEAYDLNQKKTNRILGGMMWMCLGSAKIQNVIDLSGLDLNKIEEDENEFRIGCMCSLRDLEINPGLNVYFNNVIKESVRHIVGVQFRNSATVGGSVFGRFGFSDVLTCLLALDAYVELFKGGTIPLQDFVDMKKDNDILTHIIIRKDGRRAKYISQRITNTDFPQIACCVAAKDEKWYVSVGARPMKAALLKEEYNMSAENALDFAKNSAGRLSYGSNMRASKEYRQKLAEVCIYRAVTGLLEEDENGN